MSHAALTAFVTVIGMGFLAPDPAFAQNLAQRDADGRQPGPCLGLPTAGRTFRATGHPNLYWFLTQMYARFWNDLADHASA